MSNEHRNPKNYYMLPGELANFVHNKAIPGDIAYSYDAITERHYIYYCTTENIGKDVTPYWAITDKKEMIRERLKSMSLEEKIDFLIERLI